MNFSVSQSYFICFLTSKFSHYPNSIWQMVLEKIDTKYLGHDSGLAFVQGSIYFTALGDYQCPKVNDFSVFYLFFSVGDQVEKSCSIMTIIGKISFPNQAHSNHPSSQWVKFYSSGLSMTFIFLIQLLVYNQSNYYPSSHFNTVDITPWISFPTWYLELHTVLLSLTILFTPQSLLLMSTLIFKPRVSKLFL